MLWCSQMIAIGACVCVCGQRANPNYGSAGRPLLEPLSELSEQAQEVAHTRPTLHLVISSPDRRFLHLADLILKSRAAEKSVDSLLGKKMRSLTPASHIFDSPRSKIIM